MDEIWKITVWGVRGSLPRPSPVCMEYGGNTVCTGVEYGDHVLILDAGTGLLSLGQTLASRTDVKRLDILLSHFHIDHVLGLYAFPPFFSLDKEIHLYGGTGLTRYLKTLMGPPFWPLRLQELPAHLEFAHRSDLLIWDASFTSSDLRPGWGHSTWEQGLELGYAAQAGQVLMTHYSWDYCDELIHCQEMQAGREGICRFAKEGMVMTL